MYKYNINGIKFRAFDKKIFSGVIKLDAIFRYAFFWKLLSAVPYIFRNL